MTDTLKVLGQSVPAAGVLTYVYTVPAATQATVSVIAVCNQSTATTFRISVAVAGAANAAKQYLAYDVPLSANDTKTLVIGVTLGATDVIRASSVSGNVSVNVCGVEVTA